MPLGQFGRRGQRKKSLYVQQKRNILSNIGNMFMEKQKKDIENGQIIAKLNRGKSAKTPQNLQFTGKKPLDNETIL